MFVAELDRPWIDTPFLIEGFLIEDNAQMVQLRGICDFVMIDPTRSQGDAYEAPPKPDAIVPISRNATPTLVITTQAAPQDDKTVTRTITRIKTPSAKAVDGSEAKKPADPFSNAINFG